MLCTHTAKYCNEHLNKFFLTLFLHPPYSPDYSPLDSGLHGRSFDSEKRYTCIFLRKTITFWMRIVENQIDRFQKCINAKKITLNKDFDLYKYLFNFFLRIPIPGNYETHFIIELNNICFLYNIQWKNIKSIDI